jgi:hypothetical protein
VSNSPVLIVCFYPYRSVPEQWSYLFTIAEEISRAESRVETHGKRGGNDAEWRFYAILLVNILALHSAGYLRFGRQPNRLVMMMMMNSRYVILESSEIIV